MNKDAYQNMLNAWMAKAGEYKISIAVAAICTVVILGSLFWPASKSQQPISAVKTAAPLTPSFTSTQPQPAPATAPASPAPAPATTAPAPAAPSTMEQELAAKPLFPATPQPAPKPVQSTPKTAAPVPQPAPTPRPATVHTPVVKRAIPTVQPRPVPVAAVPAGYYVQLGSYKNKDGAETLAKKAAFKHWSAYVAPRPGGLHAVWIGPYRKQTEAEQAKLKLHKDLGISGFVVQSQ